MMVRSMGKKTKNTKKPDNNGDSKDTGIDFSFDDVENEVDKILGTSKDKEGKEKPKLHHITEKIQMGMEIKHNLPDKDFLKVKAERGKVTFIDRYGEKKVKDKVIITSKDIKDVEHVEITDGLFAMDFRNDCNFWFNRSPIVVPAMINQAVHTHVDIKKCYEMEKRKLELPILLIAALIGGAAIILIMLFSLIS